MYRGFETQLFAFPPSIVAMVIICAGVLLKKRVVVFKEKFNVINIIGLI